MVDPESAQGDPPEGPVVDAPPPFDEGGPATSSDRIGDDELVWRRIPASQIKWIGDEIVLSSGAFNNSSDGSPMSVDLASIARDPIYTRGERADFGVMEFRVGDLRVLGQDVVRVDDPQNPAHAGVIGPKNGKKRKKLADLARWVVVPTRPSETLPHGSEGERDALDVDD